MAVLVPLMSSPILTFITNTDRPNEIRNKETMGKRGMPKNYSGSLKSEVKCIVRLEGHGNQNCYKCDL